MIGIYKIVSPSNRIYIGQSVNIEKRLNSYKILKSVITQPRLYNSLKKYGIDNHKFEIIEECSIELLNERERYWQDHYDVLKTGLNCRLTTTKDKSGKLSKEMRLKLSKSHKGKKLSKSHIESLKKAGKGKKNSKKSIEKMRLKAIGRKHTKKTKDKLKIVNSKNNVIDTETNIIYPSVNEVSRVFNIPLSNLQHKLMGLRDNNTKFEYVNVDKNSRARAFYIDYIPYHNSRKVIDSITNLEFRSIKDLCEYFNIPKSTMYKMLKKKNSRYKYID